MWHPDGSSLPRRCRVFPLPLTYDAATTIVWQQGAHHIDANVTNNVHFKSPSMVDRPTRWSRRTAAMLQRRAADATPFTLIGSVCTRISTRSPPRRARSTGTQNSSVQKNSTCTLYRDQDTFGEQQKIHSCAVRDSTQRIAASAVPALQAPTICTSHGAPRAASKRTTAVQNTHARAPRGQQKKNTINQ